MANFILSAFADEAGSLLSEQIAALKENEIDLIEPRNIDLCGEGGKSVTDLTEEELCEIRKQLDAAGIRVGSLGSPIGKYPIHEPFEKHLVTFEKALTAARLLGTDNMRMFSFFVEQNELSACRDEVLRRLRVMVAKAKDAGVRLCHENESRIYGQNPEQVADLLEQIPELYGIFDPANYIMNGQDPIRGIRATFKHFRYMHIKDAIFGTQTIVPAGEGEGRVGEIIDLIDAHTDDTVILTLEPHLHQFDAYKNIDDHELRGKYTFNTKREAFDFAVNTLKQLLIDHGFRKDENNVWKR